MSFREKLTEYMMLRQQSADMELAHCSCEEFHSCANCDEAGRINSALNNLMGIWGDRFIVELARREGILIDEPEAEGKQP